jgi:hypothetical protein
MSNMGLEPTREMYMDVMRAFAQHGMVDITQRIY